MSLETGIYQVLKVERESPFGYFLSDGEEDVLLHYAEAKKQKLEIGEHIEVFLYNDHKGRVAATLEKPKLFIGEIEFLEVSDYQPKMGFFLELGINKQVLLPLVELPEEKSIWPESGDQVLVKLTHDKQGRLLATLVRDNEEVNNYLSKREVAEEQREIRKNSFISGIVLYHLSEGAQVLMDNNKIGFLHRSEQTSVVRLGQKVKVRVTYIREDGRINLSMKPLKAESQVSDADLILKVLNDRGGSMPYWDKTPPDLIMSKFKMSKAAFKRALGKLMKDGLVYQEEGWTYLKK